MSEQKIYLLTLVKNINKGSEVSIPSIDMRVIRKYPEIIYQDKLKKYLSDLEEGGFLSFIDSLTLKITDKGIAFLSGIDKVI